MNYNDLNRVLRIMGERDKIQSEIDKLSIDVNLKQVELSTALNKYPPKFYTLSKALFTIIHEIDIGNKISAKGFIKYMTGCRVFSADNVRNVTKLLDFLFDKCYYCDYDDEPEGYKFSMDKSSIQVTDLSMDFDPCAFGAIDLRVGVGMYYGVHGAIQSKDVIYISAQTLDNQFEICECVNRYVKNSKRLN